MVHHRESGEVQKDFSLSKTNLGRLLIFLFAKVRHRVFDNIGTS
jgi:hypothetical protein